MPERLPGGSSIAQPLLLRKQPGCDQTPLPGIGQHQLPREIARSVSSCSSRQSSSPRRLRITKIGPLFVKNGLRHIPSLTSSARFLRPAALHRPSTIRNFSPPYRPHTVIGPDKLLEPSGDLLQNLVAYQMPMCIINLFRMVNIANHNRDRSLLPG